MRVSSVLAPSYLIVQTVAVSFLFLEYIYMPWVPEVFLLAAGIFGVGRRPGRRIWTIFGAAVGRSRKPRLGNIYKALNSRSSTLATRFQEMLRDYTIAFR